MARLTISIPDEMSEYVASRVATGEYGDISDYFCSLVQIEQQRLNATDELERMLEEGESSGVSELSVRDVWDQAEKRHLARNARVRPQQTRSQ